MSKKKLYFVLLSKFKAKIIKLSFENRRRHKKTLYDFPLILEKWNIQTDGGFLCLYIG